MMNKIRNILRRKFQLCNINIDSKNIEMKFKLTNFIHFNKENFSIKTNKIQNISFNFKKHSKNVFSIKINLNDLPSDNLTFDFYYKNQMLWLVSNEDIDTILELKNKIYIVKVNKSLMLNKYKSEFKLVNEYKEVGISQINDECISFNTDAIVESLILLNDKQQMEIPIVNNKLNLSSITRITKRQNYIVYIVVNKHIYRPQFIQQKKVNYLFMEYEWLNNNLNIFMNTLQLSQFHLNSLLNETSIRIRAIIENIDDDYKFESLGLIDDDLSNLEYLTTKIYNSIIFSKIEISSLENMNNKKLIAIYHNEQNDSKKFYVLNSKKKLSYTDYYISHEQMSQINIKKKNGISIVRSTPKIKVGVNAITEDNINIYFQPNTIYETFQSFITFEERTPQKRYEKEIHIGEQDIEIPYKEIENLKTTSKNIIDIFISIYDGTNLIRKEKIKFTKGIYKKDNYITLK